MSVSLTERNSAASPTRLALGVSLGVPCITVLRPDCQREPTTVLSPDPRLELSGSSISVDICAISWSRLDDSSDSWSSFESSGSSTETRLEPGCELLLLEPLAFKMGLENDVLLDDVLLDPDM